MANPLIVNIHEALGELVDQPPMYLERVYPLTLRPPAAPLDQIPCGASGKG
jgi:hypothetical protein